MAQIKKRGTENLFASIVDAAISDIPTQLNALDFLESAEGPKIHLLPVQRFLFKAIMGIPMDYREQMVEVWDDFRENIICTLTESDYLKYVYDQGRCNFYDWRDLPEKGFQEAEILAGRRGGKSTWIAAIATAKLRQLLSHKSPHLYYRLVDGDPIDFTLLAQDEDGANRLYDKVKQAINQAEFFRPYIFGKPGVTGLQCITEADRHRRDVQPSINVGSWPCTTRASRGPSSFLLVFDEFAHFRNASGASSDAVYESATPATSRFVSRDELGKEHLDSLVVTITSPWTKVGKSYDLWREGMTDGKDASLFVFQSSTAEMAGREVAASYLRNKYRRDPVKWQAEHGGKFLESSGTFASIANIEGCIDTGRKNTTQFSQHAVGNTYFWGTDLGFLKDATALAICHWAYNAEGRIVLIYDYIDRMLVGEGPYEHVDALNVEEVLNWFVAMNNVLPGRYGCTDQYAGAMFVQMCQQRNLDFMELVHLSAGINSEMYYALQGYINQGIARFPDEPKFKHEISTVEAYYVGKHQIKVEAPNEPGAHDDMCDAAALAAWKAQKWMLEDGAKHFAFTGDQISPMAGQLRPGDLGPHPELSSFSDIRRAERAQAATRQAAINSGAMHWTPLRAARRGRF